MADLSVREPERKKRKLRFPRATQACTFCRKRKVRCSGSLPCDVCVREEAVCEFEIPPDASKSPGTARPSITLPDTPIYSRIHESDDSSRATSACQDAPIVSRRNSIDPPQTFMRDSHVGPTSGVSFLYGQWGKTGNQGDPSDVNIPQAPLMSWGDIPQISSAARSVLPETTFTAEQLSDILDRYFQYVSPTYRFLHHQTVKRWAAAMASNGELSAARKACVLLVCAQSLLHSPNTPEQQAAGRGNPELSLACFEEAKSLLDKEPGPPALPSVQARVGLCLYFLSTFRLNECRYCFSFAVTLATTLGLHRKQSSTSRINTLEAECRKRCFWSLYVLDGYLGVMLGRPRLLRDEDIDQSFPCNISDNDLTSDEVVDDLPQHGNLEAAISHAKLAKLMAKGNDLLYPLHTLSNHQLLQRSNEMLDALEKWQKDLPAFLQARQKTFTGLQTFARQNTILKLAWAHVRILATRRCLLMDFTHPSQAQDPRAKRCIQECISAIVMVLDTVEALIEHGQCYKSFWSTQYIALVAISTLYVLIIQGVRIDNFSGVEDCVEKARRCHDHLATLPPTGSQVERHHVLLSHLRSKAERSLTKRKMPKSDPRPHNNGGVVSSKRSSAGAPDEVQTSSTDANTEFAQGPPLMHNTSFSGPSNHLDHSISMMNQDAPNDMSMFGSMLTPNSSADSFQYMLDFGWESLDTIGASVRGEGMYGYQGM